MHSTEEKTQADAKTRTVLSVDLSRSTRFHLPKQKTFEPQYANIYFSRLKALSPPTLKSAKAIFGEPVQNKLNYAERIVDISKQGPGQVVIVGVIFRHMPSKPSILAQYEAPSHELIPPPPNRSHTSYVGEEDNVYIEDEYGRCALDLSALDSSTVALSFATGFVLALKGTEQATTGAFKVSAFTSAGQAPQPSLPTLGSDKYLCLVSGLCFGKSDMDIICTELFLEFLRGNSGDESEETASAQIAQMIVAGNVVADIQQTESGCAAILASHRPVKSGEKERTASPIIEVDRFLSAVASTVPVAVMPGEADPANYLLPQQPLHPCLLPSSSRNENLRCVTNPFECALDKRVILGTSGQPVEDFRLYEGKDGVEQVGSEKVLDIMELMLRNRHIAPTCPDTLACYPFANGVDPFVLEHTPHVFFAGNQREFGTRLVRGPRADTQMSDEGESVPAGEKIVRLVAVPRFDTSGQAVMVNLRTLDCTVREFALTM